MENAMTALSASPMSTSSAFDRGVPTPSRFWDRRAVDYAKKPVADERAYEQTLERVRAHLLRNVRVLEIGCGTGTTALKLAASAREILATDYSEEMIAIARAKARAEVVSNVHFRTCTVHNSELGVGSFDVVLAMNLLHLLGDIPARLGRIHELLRPGGLFISKTPCLGDQGLLMRIVIPLMRALGIAPYVNFVSERSLTADIEQAGFQIVETGMYPKKTRSFFVVARKTP
ncbi:MAG TPA: class I SAM-dependent methyltransferase [Polyangiaceae bacterium]|nr:class I SAM-dependent methyltransferase [Polyangiaceae bacterium]